MNTLNLENIKKLGVLLSPINEKQKRFIQSSKRFLMYSGAVSAGKTKGGCIKVLLLCLLYPGSRGLICRKEARSLYGSTYHTLMQTIPQELILEIRQMKGEIVVKTTDPENPSIIVLSGLDKRADETYPQKIGSTEYNFIFVDEGTELDEGDWSMLITRLRYRFPHLSDESNRKIVRQMFTATNPSSPYHFLYKFFWKDKDPDREAILTTPYENPTLTKEYIKSLEKTLTGVMRERLLYGKWVAAEGLIYERFDPAKHVVDLSSVSSGKLELKDYKDLIVGADANYPLPRAAVLIGFKGDGSIDILDEFYKTSSHIEELGQWVSEYAKKAGKSIKVYHDPSDPSAIDKLNMISGVMCEKAENAVVAGISAVSRYFDNDLIRIDSKCINLIEELLSYAWEINKQGDKPRKKQDHATDAARYALFSHLVGAGRVALIDVGDDFF